MKDKKYFKNLNYTLGNEDSSLEYEVLPNKVNHIFSIAGSGSRVLPLLAKKPKKLTCVDTSYEQLYFTELRIESLRTLDYENFLAFWGYPPISLSPIARKKAFESISLTPKANKFLRQIFEVNNWDSLLYIGRWERTFVKLSRINRLFTGKKGAKLFEYKASSDYYNYLKNGFPHLAWKLTVLLLGNAAVFNTLLYKGHFPKKNIPGNLHSFYINSFKRLFHQGPARNNFLLQLLFFGKLLFPGGNPIECDAKIFSLAKEGIKKSSIAYIHGNIIEEVIKSREPIDFVSFSDVPSYFSGDTEKTFLKEIHKNLSPDCLLVIRNYLHIPEGAETKGYNDVTNHYKSLIEREKIQMYVISILKKTL